VYPDRTGILPSPQEPWQEHTGAVAWPVLATPERLGRSAPGRALHFSDDGRK
jgi:hypothetical protein